MKKYYEILYAEPYEEGYLMGITTDLAAAEHYCQEANQCTESWGVYYVSEHRHPKSLDLTLPLEFSFTFQAGNLELEASDVYVYIESECGYRQEEGTIVVNGTGSTYAECLYDAQTKAVAVRRSYLKEHL